MYILYSAQGVCMYTIPRVGVGVMIRKHGKVLLGKRKRISRSSFASVASLKVLEILLSILAWASAI